MIDKIIFATTNQGKMDEIRMIMSDCSIPIVSLKEAGIKADIVEDGKTFEENGKTMLPLAIQVHHAVCDGYHVGKFIETLQANINKFDA